MKPIMNDSVLEWLLQPEDPGVRYLALRDLVKIDAEDPVLISARREAHSRGPIAAVLGKMEPEGFWSKPGAGYLPKYFSSVWSVLLLAQLGASVEEEARIERACAYLFDHALARGGQFGGGGTPSTTVDCLQGNLCWALSELGAADPRLEKAYHWMAISVTGEGVAPQGQSGVEPRYYAGKCGPRFLCGANNKLACAWGAVKVVLALGKIPAERRKKEIKEAIQVGADFLLERDPALAPYPNGWAEKPSRNWWKFGFPVFYVTDILQIAEALVSAGCGSDPRLKNTLDLIAGKADPKGRWLLEYDYRGKTHVDFGPKRMPNKWVTLRALRVLQAAR
jgi:hypothetical protein